MSYPKYLIEQAIGRKLLPNEQVHHKDGNPLNNELENLEIKLLGNHQSEHNQKYKKYYDTEIVCANCGKRFIKTALQLKTHNANCNRNKKPIANLHFCSKQCVGKYGKKKQMNQI